MKDEGNFKAGKMDGSWKGWLPNSIPIYEGFYKDDLKDGAWKLFYDSGKIKATGNYKKGKNDGHWIAFTPYGFKDSEGVYKEEKFDGLWTYYYQTGVKSMEQTFRDGLLAGDCATWGEDAKLRSTSSYTLVKSKNGRIESKPNGKWVYYDKNENIINEVTYKKGEKVK